MQYPPPYPAQPMGPPAYHETLAGECPCWVDPTYAFEYMSPDTCTQGVDHCCLLPAHLVLPTAANQLLSVSGGAAMPYVASQPPYNPAYTDSPKAAP